MTAFLQRGGEAMNSIISDLFQKKNEFEKCVLCWKATDVPKTANIQDRAFFVEGVGQLCRRCWEKTYYAKERN